MNYWLLIIPLISAFIGWLMVSLAIKMLFHPYQPKKILGISFHGVIPKRLPHFAKKLGELVNTLFSFDDIENKISDPANLEKIIPMIETHVDDFLRNRLSTEMPVISMFIGDKTIIKLKTAFMKEIETLFPLVMKQYAGNLRTELDLKYIVIKKVSGISSEDLEKILQQALSKEFRQVKIAGAIIGLIIGVVQIVISVLMT